MSLASLRRESRHLRAFYDEIGLPDRVVAELADAEEFFAGSGPWASLRHYVPDLLDPARAESAADRLIASADALIRNAPDFPFPAGLAVLRIELEAALAAWDRTYVPLGIDRATFAATMRHFSLFMEERWDGFHDVDFDRGWWAWRFTAGLEFRVGTLFYEMTTYPAGHAVSGNPMLAIHIPKDADLDNPTTHASFRAAHAFFMHYFPQFHYTRAATDSWLLSPALEPLLGPTSRIRQFRGTFHLVTADLDSDAALHFLFLNPDIHPADMPETTSLQRSVKAVYLSGGHAGVGFGELVHDGHTMTWETDPFKEVR